MKNKKDNITIYQMEKSSVEYKKSHTIQVSGLADNEMPNWFKKFHEEEFRPLVETVVKMQNDFKSFQQTMLDFVCKQEEFNKLVIEQFKKHGWVK